MKVNGKTIVVTGGGSGMGRELVLELAKRGASVAAVDINKEAVLETARLAPESKEKISTHVVNITEREAIEKLVDEVKEFHGTVDGIINNAGIIQPFIDVNDLGYDKIEQVMNVNFYGTLYMVKSFLPELLKRPEAHILNVASMGGFLPVPGQSIYGASKAAVKLMTEGLHSELTDTNVGVTIAFPLESVVALRSTFEFFIIFVLMAPGKAIVTPTFVSVSSECSPSVISLTAAFDAP